MTTARIITAIGTPLQDDDRLHEEGLYAHLEDQLSHGVHGILVAGSMGYAQLQSDQTYHRLIQLSAEWAAGRMEILAGAGDTSFARTRDRIHLINRYVVDGIAVVTPFFAKFTQDELIAYYRALADEARTPLYLYDLPGVTGVKLEISTVLDLAQHPNIVGIKSSDRFDQTRLLLDALAEEGHDFRVIVAQPDLLDMVVRHGVRDHLDGLYAIAPHWAMQVVVHTESGDHEAAARVQNDLSSLRRIFNAKGPGSFTAFMNVRGIPGGFAPRPFRELTPLQHKELLADPVVQRLICER